jgi:hypothetical protein
MESNKQRKPHRPSLANIVRQVARAGVVVARVEIEPSGKIIIVTGKGDSVSAESNNPWDEVLSGNGRRSGP